MNGRKTVQIDVQGKWAVVDGDVERLLMPLLTSTRSRFVPSEVGFGRRICRESFCRRARSDKLVIPTGVVPDIRAHLEQSGYQVSVQGRMLDTPVVPSPGIAVSPAGQHLLDALGDQPSGVVELSGQDAIGSIALICRAYSKLRILIAVASRKQVRRLHREFRRQLGSTVRTSETWGDDGRQLVATDYALEHANPLDWDLIVLPHADQLARRQHFPGQALLLKRPVLGLVSNWAGLGMREKLRLQLLCGPLLYRRNETGFTGSAVQVLWCQPPMPIGVSPQPGLERKRHGWWHNRERNELIAGLASAFAAGDVQVLWNHGLMLDEREAPPRRVTVLVESPEHGRELLGLLPGWRLSTANDERPEQQDQFDRTIITMLRACQLPKFQTDVLVRADGGEGMAALNSLTGQQGHFATLVDFADDFDAAARRATWQRASGYRSRGWAEHGTPGWLQNPSGATENAVC